MKYYLQISLPLITSLLLSNGWNMNYYSTIYKNNNSNTIYVIDANWIDSMTIPLYQSKIVPIYNINFDSVGYEISYTSTIIGTQKLKLDSNIFTSIYLGTNDSIFQQLYLNDSEVIKK